MKKLNVILCAGVATLGLSWAGIAAAQSAPAPTPAPAAPAPPAATPMANPAMGPTLSANPHPATFDAGPLGNIVVDGVVSGLAFYQSPSDLKGPTSTRDGFADIDNAMVIVNKSDGPVQFYFQAGAYSFPTVGVPYTYTSKVTPNTFGYLPQGFLKIQPNSLFSIQAGALPTLIGAELGWTFQNMNIERGLLWNTEPLVSKGVQANFTSGPITASIAWTDGYYTNEYSNVSGLFSYAITSADTITVAGEGNVRPSFAVSNIALAGNGSIYNLIYTHTQGPWTINPYFQYQTVPSTWYEPSGSAWGAAVLAKYNVTSDFSLAGRFEYESSSGGANILGYGPGSSAWSLTFTPGWQHGIFFARGEFSYVGLTKFTNGFSSIGNNSTEYRFALESGFLF